MASLDDTVQLLYYSLSQAVDNNRKGKAGRMGRVHENLCRNMR